MGNKTLTEKISVLIISSWVGNRFGLLFPTISLLFFLMVTDYISGMLAAKKEALAHPDDKRYGWNRKKSLLGIYKKMGYIFIILVAVTTDYLIYKFANEIGIDFSNNTMFGLLITIWLIINELLSILENAHRMGVSLPEFLKKALAEAKNNIDKN